MENFRNKKKIILYLVPPNQKKNFDVHFVENPGSCPEPLFLPSSTRRRKRSSKASHSEKQPSRWIFFHKRKKILKEKSGNTETHKYFFKQWRTQMHIWKWGHGQSSKSGWGGSPSKSTEFNCKRAMTERKITLLPLNRAGTGRWC